jgi:hypothetical protein
LHLFRGAVQRLRLQLFDHDIVLVAGIDQASLALLRRECEQQGRRQLVVAAVDEQSVDDEVLRTIGALPLQLVFGPDRMDLRHVLMRRGALQLRRVVLVDANPEVNLENLAVIRDIVRDGVRKHSFDPANVPVVTGTVRVDDPCRAEHVRQVLIAQMTSDTEQTGLMWMIDVVSSVELGAAQLAGLLVGDDLQAEGSLRSVSLGSGERPWPICISGFTDMGLAVCLSLARQMRVLGEDPATERPIWIAGPDAARLVAQYQHMAGRYSLSQNVRLLPSAHADADWVGDVARLDDGSRITLVETQAISNMEAAELATRFPGWEIFCLDPQTEGANTVESLDGLRLFGATLDVGASQPIDAVEWVAQQAHVRFMWKQTHVPTEPGKPPPGLRSDRLAHRPWDRLPEFFRQDNIRQVTRTIQSIRELGYGWDATDSHGSGPDLVRQILDDRLWSAYDCWPGWRRSTEWLKLGQWEHESWVDARLKAGWVCGDRLEVVDDGKPAPRPAHPEIRPWAEEDEEQRWWVITGVRDCLKMLHDAGFHVVVGSKSGGVDCG